MIEAIRDQWQTALTDGSYKQGQSELAYTDDEGVTRYCCLGVLCDLAVNAGVLTTDTGTNDGGVPVTIYVDSEGRRFQSYLPWEVVTWAGLEDRAWYGQSHADDESGDTDGTSAGTDIAVTAGDNATLTSAISRRADRTLAGLNDDGKTFAEIAAVVGTF